MHKTLLYLEIVPYYQNASAHVLQENQTNQGSPTWLDSAYHHTTADSLGWSQPEASQFYYSSTTLHNKWTAYKHTHICPQQEASNLFSFIEHSTIKLKQNKLQVFD